jgi:RNA polymerase sigma-70 factor, ECF subfamily
MKTEPQVSQGAIALGLASAIATVDDEEALVAAARKDTDAAAQLYSKYYHPIFRYIYRSTLDYSSTEDLTSNVFISAFKNLGRFRWRRVPFSAWLYRIATNEIRMHHRRRTRSKVLPLGSDTRESPAVTSPVEDLVDLEQYRLLHTALLELRPKYRAALMLHYFEQKTVTEISQITNRSAGAVKSRLHRGLAQLQEVLARRGILQRKESNDEA